MIIQHKSNASIFSISAIFAIPVIFPPILSANLSLPLAVILVPFAFYSFAIQSLTKEKIAYIIFIILSLIGITIYSYAFNSSFFKSLLSLIWFSSPYLFFFLGKALIKSKYSYELFIKYFTYTSIVSYLSLIFSIAFIHGGSVTGQVDNEFTIGVEVGRSYLGNIFGLQLYGAWGVNSLAAYFVVAHSIIMVFVLNIKKYNKIFFYMILIVLNFLILFSISRGAILSLFLLYLSLFMLRIKNKKYSIYLIGFFITVGLLGYFYMDYVTIIIETKLTRNLNSINSFDVNDLLSGRSLIFDIMLEQISRNPLLGSGFSGFGVNASSLQTTSPHNQYLGALWKMGIIAFIPYSYFLFRILSKLFSKKLLSDSSFSPIVFQLIIFVLMANFVWDNFTVPLLGYLLMFLIGALHGINKEEKYYETSINFNK